MLRAYAKYLRQAAFTFSQGAIEAAMLNNSQVVRQLVRLFHARFDPVGASGDADLLSKRIWMALRTLSRPMRTGFYGAT